MDEERWFRVILDDGRHFLLEGTKFYYDPSGNFLKVIWGEEEVAYFSAGKVVAVIDEEQYQAGIEKRESYDIA